MEQFRADAERLLVEARARDVGVHILKTVASGPWGERPPTHSTWYVPFSAPVRGIGATA